MYVAISLVRQLSTVGQVEVGIEYQHLHDESGYVVEGRDCSDYAVSVIGLRLLQLFPGLLLLITMGSQ